jgi:hypothetical protein
MKGEYGNGRSEKITDRNRRAIFVTVMKSRWPRHVSCMVEPKRGGRGGGGE